MGGPVKRAPPKPLNTIVCFDAYEDLRGPQLAPHDAERRQSLGRLIGVFFPVWDYIKQATATDI